MKNFKNLSVVFLSLMAFSSLRAMPPMFVEGEPEEKSPKQVESGHPGDRSRDATADSSSALARNPSGVGGAVDLSSSIDAPQNQAPSSFASESWADMDDWANMQDNLFDGTSSVYTVPLQQVKGSVPVIQRIGTIMSSMKQSKTIGFLPLDTRGRTCTIGKIEYTQHALEQMAEGTTQDRAAFKSYNQKRKRPSENPRYRAITHDEVEALLRKSNLKVIGAVENNPSLPIQEIGKPGSLIVRVISSELNYGRFSRIKVETAFRPQDNRNEALLLLQQVEDILKTVCEEVNIQAAWNEAGIEFPGSSAMRAVVNQKIRNYFDKLSEEQKKEVQGLLNKAWTLCNEADRDESRS